MNLLNYSSLIRLCSFEERYSYLQLSSKVGQDTFGFDRYLNQMFYKSSEWRSLRNQIIIRDEGCDLAHPEHVIYGKILIHHMNPISKNDILQHSDLLMNPEYLICVSPETHSAIHYGDLSQLPSSKPAVRRPGDTCPWKHT